METSNDTVAAPGADSGPPLLQVRDLSVEFPTGRKRWGTAVDRVSFDVKAGESVALVGESGSGKTVTSLAAMGLTGMTGGRISSGSVTFDGQELTSAPDKVWRGLRGTGMGMIFQQPIRSLNPAFTVGDQIAESVRRHLGLSKKAAMSKAVEMLELVKIPRAMERVREYPYAFSGGMCQRVMIAMVMATNPRLLIADEPTTALDVTVQETILELLRDLQEQTGVALLFVSHDLGVVAEVCQKVVVMYAGQAVENGTVDDIFFRPRHPYSSGLLSAIPRPGDGSHRLRTIPGVIPPAGDWPDGCRFFQRCEFAIPGLCDSAEPPMIRAGETDLARCVRTHELSLPGVVIP